MPSRESKRGRTIELIISFEVDSGTTTSSENLITKRTVAEIKLFKVIKLPTN